MLPEKGVCGKKYAVFKENIVYPDNSLVSKHPVVVERRPAVKGVADREMGIVVKVPPCADDPIDISRFHHRNETRSAQAGGSQRSGHAHPDRAIVCENFLGE